MEGLRSEPKSPFQKSTWIRRLQSALKLPRCRILGSGETIVRMLNQDDTESDPEVGRAARNVKGTRHEKLYSWRSGYTYRRSRDRVYRGPFWLYRHARRPAAFAV